MPIKTATTPTTPPKKRTTLYAPRTLIMRKLDAIQRPLAWLWFVVQVDKGAPINRCTWYAKFLPEGHPRRRTSTVEELQSMARALKERNQDAYLGLPTITRK